MKIDFHVHTFYSEDGLCSPEKMLKSALKKGLDGIAITDHDTTEGWKEAKKAAEKLKAVLVLGQEIKIKKNGKIMGEILAFFLKKGIDSQGKTAKEIIEEIKDQGGIAIISHPFHWRKSFKELEKYKNLVDGIEVFNARSHSQKGNQKSLEFAKKNNLAMTAGSDAHSFFEVGRAYLEVEAENLFELKEAILKKRVKIRGQKASIFSLFFSFLGKLLHLFWQPKNSI
jgi:predicted metal-dependent phosphoesterase TrpH